MCAKILHIRGVRERFTFCGSRSVLSGAAGAVSHSLHGLHILCSVICMCHISFRTAMPGSRPLLVWIEPGNIPWPNRCLDRHTRFSGVGDFGKESLHQSGLVLLDAVRPACYGMGKVAREEEGCGDELGERSGALLVVHVVHGGLAA